MSDMLARGSKLQVWNGTAKKTPGGLTKGDLMENKRGKIVSKKQHMAGQMAKMNLGSHLRPENKQSGSGLLSFLGLGLDDSAPPAPSNPSVNVTAPVLKGGRLRRRQTGGGFLDSLGLDDIGFGLPQVPKRRQAGGGILDTLGLGLAPAPNNPSVNVASPVMKGGRIKQSPSKPMRKQRGRGIVSDLLGVGSHITGSLGI